MNEKTLQAPFSQIFTSIQGEGILVGLPQVFVRFAQCNLKCRFCDTSLSPRFFLTPIELTEKVRKYSSFDWVALTGGEPLLFTSFLQEFLPRIKRKTYLETNGTLPGEFKKIVRLVNFISLDFKLPSATGLKDYFREHQEFLSLSQQKKGYVKIIVTPQTNEEDFKKALRIMKEAKSSFPLVLQPATTSNHFFLKNSLKKLLSFYKLGKKFWPELEIRIIPQVHRLAGWL